MKEGLYANAIPLWLWLIVALVCSPTWSFAKSGSGYAKVTYIASEAVYVNAGSNQGLGLGDTLVVLHRADTVALLIVTNVSQKSSACEVNRSSRQLSVGEKVSLKGYRNVPRASSLTGRAYRATGVGEKDRKGRRNRKRHAAKDAVSGSLSFGNLFRQDQTGSGLSSDQFGIRTNVAVENIQGRGVRFEMRHRSRLYHRSRPLGVGLDTDEWSHQVYEFGVSYGDDSSPVRWGVGRLLAPGVRGMGYIDGVYLAHRINRNWQAGVAGGLTPDAQTSSVRLKATKAGIFASYSNTFSSVHRVTLSGSLTTEIESFNVSRDFMYLQGLYHYGRIVSFSQSLELEINRGWRHDVSGKRFELSNYYATLNANVWQNASVFVSYDTRRNVRHFDDLATPDSLFDQSTHRGVRGGFRVRPLRNLRLWGNLGVRIREGMAGNNKFGTMGARINRFPSRGHSLALSMSYVQTQFTTGYRPTATYRFPVGRQTHVNVTGSAYIYQTVSTTVSNFYLDIGASRPLGKRYFLTGSYRQYFDSNLRSGELYTEIGLRL